MDYFIMHQDERVKNVAELEPGSQRLSALNRQQIDEISMTKILYVKESGYNEYPDYIEAGGRLVSEKLKRIMSKYQRDVIFKTAMLIEKNINRQEIYYLISPPQIECAAAETVYDRQGNVERFVLDEHKVGHTRIFCAVNYGNHIFVRLDVAESILRRDSYGVSFEKVNVSPKEGV